MNPFLVNTGRKQYVPWDHYNSEIQHYKKQIDVYRQHEQEYLRTQCKHEKEIKALKRTITHYEIELKESQDFFEKEVKLLRDTVDALIRNEDD
jgi:predicted  nucleic acid-binding Zn-ribbon protein